MRTLPLVLAVVLVNDVVLLVALDVAVPAWLLVLAGALALTVPLAAIADVTAGGDGDSSPAERRPEVEASRERAGDPED